MNFNCPETEQTLIFLCLGVDCTWKVYTRLLNLRLVYATEKLFTIICICITFLVPPKLGNAYNSIIYSKECSCVRKDKINDGLLKVFRPSATHPIIKNQLWIFFYFETSIKILKYYLFFYLIRHYCIGWPVSQLTLAIWNNNNNV